jgi:hypothetical protein
VDQNQTGRELKFISVNWFGTDVMVNPTEISLAEVDPKLILTLHI